MGLSCKGVEGGYWRGIDGRKLGFFVDICKLFLIFKPPLENGVSIWSSRRGKVLVEGGRGRTVASPVDRQRRWGLLPWKQGLTGSSILHTSPTWTQQTISIWRSQLTSLEEFLWKPTWQWEQHGSRWKAKLLAGEAGHSRRQRESSSARLKNAITDGDSPIQI